MAKPATDEQIAEWKTRQWSSQAVVDALIARIEQEQERAEAWKIEAVYHGDRGNRLNEENRRLRGAAQQARGALSSVVERNILPTDLKRCVAARDALHAALEQTAEQDGLDDAGRRTQDLAGQKSWLD